MKKRERFSQPRKKQSKKQGYPNLFKFFFPRFFFPNRFFILSVIFFSLILALFLFTACQPSSGPGLTQQDLRQGLGKLELDFFQLEEEMYENTYYDLILNLKNNGAYDIENGKLLLIIDKNLVTPQKIIVEGDGGRQEFDGLVASFDIEGKKPSLLDGGRLLVDYRIKTRKISLTEKQPTTFNLLACYPYQSVLQTQICLNPNIYQPDKPGQVCQPAESSFSGQGSPVSITFVKPIMRPDEQGDVFLEFEIEVENLGGGLVLNKDKYEQVCSAQAAGFEAYDWVEISGQVGNQELECHNQGIIRLREGLGKIRCQVGRIQGSSAYWDLLQLELDYAYQTHLNKEVFVIR